MLCSWSIESRADAVGFETAMAVSRASVLAHAAAHKSDSSYTDNLQDAISDCMNSLLQEQPPVGLAIWRMSRLLAAWKPKPKSSLPAGEATSFLEAQRDAMLSEAVDLFFFPGGAAAPSQGTTLGSAWTTTPEATEDTHFE